MWLTSFMAKNMKDTASASTGSITDAKGGRVEVDASAHHRNLPVVAPYGIVYVPAVGADAVVVHTDSGEACIGVVAPDIKDLSAGELMLCSAGGASIVLKNDGTVVINGAVYGGA